jgi:hypothetical protein
MDVVDRIGETPVVKETPERRIAIQRVTVRKAEPVPSPSPSAPAP